MTHHDAMLQTDVRTLVSAVKHELCKSTVVQAPLGIGNDVVGWLRTLIEVTNAKQAELSRARQEVEELTRRVRDLEAQRPPVNAVSQLRLTEKA